MLAQGNLFYLSAMLSNLIERTVSSALLVKVSSPKCAFDAVASIVINRHLGPAQKLVENDWFIDLNLAILPNVRCRKE